MGYIWKKMERNTNNCKIQSWQPGPLIHNRKIKILSSIYKPKNVETIPLSYITVHPGTRASENYLMEEENNNNEEVEI